MGSAQKQRPHSSVPNKKLHPEALLLMKQQNAFIISGSEVNLVETNTKRPTTQQPLKQTQKEYIDQINKRRYYVAEMANSGVS
jgi:cellulase/cellobiase CelA1